MLEKEYEYFKRNKDVLFKEYPNKYVLIVGENVIKAFNSMDEAYMYALKSYEPGQFLIDQCTGEIKPQVFHSRAIFA